MYVTKKVIKTKRPVSKIHSKLNYASYSIRWIVHGEINYFVSVGMTFEILTFVIKAPLVI